MSHRHILVGGEKGGTGKTTIATNLALMFIHSGLSTHLFDCNAKQATAQRFANRRASNGIQPNLIATCGEGDQLHVPISDLANRYDAVVIDCGGQDTVELRSCMVTLAVELLVIPVQPGIFDLETLVKMDSLVRTSRKFNPNLNAKVVINRAKTNKGVSSAQEAADFIRHELPHLGLFDTILHDRVAYGYAAAKGLSLVEWGRDDKAAAEMKSLYSEIAGRTYG